MGFFDIFFKAKSVSIQKVQPKKEEEELVDLSQVTSPYHFDEMIYDSSRRCYFAGHNLEVALSVVPTLNKLIREAQRCYSDVPQKFFSTSILSKDIITENGRELSPLQLTIHSLTKAKRQIPKCPYTITYFQGDDFFAHVSYNKNGTIEKINFIIWNSKKYLIEVNTTNKDGELAVKSIYRSDLAGPNAFKKQKMYDAGGKK